LFFGKDRLFMIKISVRGNPPYKQASAGLSESENQKEREELLKKKAKETMKGKVLLTGSLEMKITYHRSRG